MKTTYMLMEGIIMAEKTFKEKITAQGTEITVLSQGNDDDFISLSDIARYKNTEFPSEVIQNWMRNRSQHRGTVLLC